MWQLIMDMMSYANITVKNKPKAQQWNCSDSVKKIPQPNSYGLIES